MRKNTETSDFWLCVFPDNDTFSEYFGYTLDAYRLLDDDPAFVPVDLFEKYYEEHPISQFAADQGESYFDQNKIEVGFSEDAATIADLVEGFSYSQQYVLELQKRADALGLSGINVFAFVTSGLIREPKSFRSEKFEGYYVGQITYEI